MHEWKKGVPHRSLQTMYVLWSKSSLPPVWIAHEIKNGFYVLWCLGIQSEEEYFMKCRHQMKFTFHCSLECIETQPCLSLASCVWLLLYSRDRAECLHPRPCAQKSHFLSGLLQCANSRTVAFIQVKDDKG